MSNVIYGRERIKIKTLRRTQTMKTYLNLRNLRSITLALAFVSLLTALTAYGQTNGLITRAADSTARGQTNQPSISVHLRNSPGVPSTDNISVRYYDIDFPGGSVRQFFDFWRKHGFAKDSVLFAGEVESVFIPSFKIKDARLSEVANSIEFITEGRLIIKVVEKDSRELLGNIWTVKNVDAVGLGQIKTRSCALPAIFSGPNPNDRIHNMADEVKRTLFESVESMRYDARIWGRVQVLDSEKIVVVIGTETYVEAITGVLEAAEKVAEAEKVEKSKPK